MTHVISACQTKLARTNNTRTPEEQAKLTMDNTLRDTLPVEMCQLVE